MSEKQIVSRDTINCSNMPQDKLTAFLASATDSYAVLQLRSTKETETERFASLSSLHRQGREPEFDHYAVTYTAGLSPHTDQDAVLEQLYMKFNLDQPPDFTGHSLSVSDIVALKTDGEVSYHYVDTFGFQELPDFI